MMKKMILILAMAFVGASASAQVWQCNIGITYGAFDRSGLGGSSEIIDVQRQSTVNGSHYESSPTILPTFSLEAGCIMDKAPVGFFMGVFWNYAWNNLNGGPSLLTEKENIFHFLPEVRFYYYTGEKVQLYSIMAAGLRYRRFSETFEGDRIANGNFGFSYQFVPFGMSCSINRWNINCEIGHGMAWSLMKLGVGYTF
jgi:hypothetical protein